MTTLTEEQRRIVEWDEGPAVVIAGAGTGKTRVIVERVRHLLETRPDLLPEQILVLTYNVKAAAELRARLEQAVGLATAARMEIGNFHSFCQGILSDHAGDAGLPARPDVLDGVGQLLLLRDIAPDLDLVYHGTGTWTLANIVHFINRCKDELVTSSGFEAFVAQERRIFEERYGAFDAAADRLGTQGNLNPIKPVRGAYASLRANERAEARGEQRTYKPNMVETAADREARRTLAGDGSAKRRNQFAPEEHAAIDALADTYVKDAAALEVLRLTELHRVFAAYEVELAKRGALDYGEQIAGVAQLFKTRPNVLRKLQRQYRYLLIDEFQDANVAQIEIIELLGRSPDRPDNVMVVGDDDQSIYRFRGASFAAFAEFERRFAQPPVHDRTAEAPGPPPRLRLEQNFRSDGHVLSGANRLIALNATRFVPDKRLITDHPDGEPIQIVVCSSPEDEAVAIVDLIKGRAAGKPLTDVAILYRKHRHRDAIVARLRDEDIPYTVVGGLSLFATPEIRDLEQGLRAIANPEDDAAFVRMLTAGPWRLDAIDILRVTRMAAFDKRHLIDVVGQIVDAGQVEVDRVGETTAEGKPAHEAVDVDARLRGRLRLVRDAISELNPLTYREGPHTILERYLERTGQVLDLIATDTLEAKRTVTNIASFVRFAADWQRANPIGTLAGFVAYLDAYQGAGGELPTSVELSEDTEGVRLMTLYQAKGLEFPIVIVPQLLDGEWPTREGWGGYFPKELLREDVPVGDLHTDEERRLLYVAMTRAQRRLVLTTQGSVTASRGGSSRFIGEVVWGGGDDIQLVDRTPGGATTPFRAGGTAAAADDDDAPLDLGLDALPELVTDLERLVADVRRVMPLPTARERRLALRLRASELVGLMESTDARDPEAAAARAAYTDELAATGRAAALDADVAREQGLDPLSLRTIALDSGAGANLLQVAPLPTTQSYTSLSAYERCPLQYAFGYVYRMPRSEKPVAAFTFGSTAHEAFEAFTKERRERVARGEPPPTREDLEREFRSRWKPTDFGDQATEAGYARRVSTLLDNFWEGEVASLGEAIREEEDFELRLDPGEGQDPVLIRGSIDRIDKLPGGGLEVIDYKTGKVSSQKGVDESLQLSIYALACRDALDLGTPERVTLYFTESATRLSTTRTDDQLDAARADVLNVVLRMRDGEFTATPGEACRYCDYRAMCPERV
ncbi:MAG: ATP-dependent helicase [Candidatus Limnocylindrales bacterium]